MSARETHNSNEAVVFRTERARRVAGLYVIVDPEGTKGRNPVEIGAAALRGGATAIQYRDKLSDKGDQLPIACRLRDLCEAHNAVLIVNDHADLAIASGAHGLHLGQHDLPIAEARKLLHPWQFIGASSAMLSEAETSISHGADYIAVGAMYDTSSKANTRAAGIESLSQICSQIIDIPIVAIGGITLSNVDPILTAGADGICVISAIGQADDPEEQTRLFVQRITTAQLDRC